MRRRSELLSEGLLSEYSAQSGTVFSHTPLLAGHAASNGDGIGSSNDLQDLVGSAAPSPRTLKTRAVYYLSKREHSRAELAKKLSQPTYKARQAAFVHKTELPAAPSAELIESVLDDLQRQGFLNDERFAQGLARKNASKHGAARVMARLGQHKLDANTTQQLATQLKDSELPRCYEVWSKRFSHIDRSSMDYTESQAAIGKQGRFLMQRGFSGDAVKKVLNGWTPESD
jgi:regulatory protein